MVAAAAAAAAAYTACWRKSILGLQYGQAAVHTYTLIKVCLQPQVCLKVMPHTGAAV